MAHYRLRAEMAIALDNQVRCICLFYITKWPLSRSGVPGLGFLGVPGSVCSEQCVRILSQPEVLAEAPRLKFPS